MADFRGDPNQYCIFEVGYKPILPFLGGAGIFEWRSERFKAAPPPLLKFLTASLNQTIDSGSKLCDGDCKTWNWEGFHAAVHAVLFVSAIFLNLRVLDLVVFG